MYWTVVGEQGTLLIWVWWLECQAESDLQWIGDEGGQQAVAGLTAPLTGYRRQEAPLDHLADLQNTDCPVGASTHSTPGYLRRREIRNMMNE